jgi:hypothetical protein
MLSVPIAISPARNPWPSVQRRISPPGASADAQGRLAPRPGALFMCTPTPMIDGHVPAIVWPCSRPFLCCMSRPPIRSDPSCGARRGIVDEESASVSSCWRGGSRQYSRGESRPVINSLNKVSAFRGPLPEGGCRGGGRRCRTPSMPGGHRLDLVISLSSFGQEWRRFLGQSAYSDPSCGERRIEDGREGASVSQS